jgi:hypothetical protein
VQCNATKRTGNVEAERDELVVPQGLVDDILHVLRRHNLVGLHVEAARKEVVVGSEEEPPV